MKSIPLFKQNQILNLVLLILLSTGFFSQSIYGQSALTPIEILSHCVTDDTIWQQLPNNINEVSEYYILDHGVDLSIANNLIIEGKPVSLIDKNTRNTIGSQPYFLFHTLNISEAEAFVRMYLAYTSDGIEKTVEAEFSFIKKNNIWVATTKS